ncbi:hypothetical protein ACHAWF_016269 [Thalassiosira exigua]
MNNPPPPVPNPMAAAVGGPATPSAAVAAKVKPPVPVGPSSAVGAASTPSAASSAPATGAKAVNPQQQALQQQIQAQLQSQLQAQLQAAAARGKQANITPEMIQAQAQAMVQAAAQAQAVVAAAKNRGGGLVPMNAAQIAALSQIQAQAIVNARPQTALIGASGKSDTGDKPTPQQIQNQIQLQAQALVHAHTQAQVSAGIYKGGDPVAAAAAAKPKAAPQAPHPLADATTAASMSKIPPQQQHAPNPNNLIPAQQQHQHLGQTRPAAAGAPHPAARPQPAATAAPMSIMAPAPLNATTIQQTRYTATGGTLTNAGAVGGEGDGIGGVVMSATSPEFLAKLDEALAEFWAGQLQEMKELGADRVQTEHDFKNHNDLPLARIKRIMKSDEDVRMISAEAPVLFAKACEMFILEMTLRSWNYSENNKRKTLQKEDVKEAIQRTDIFDFLVDVIH